MTDLSIKNLSYVDNFKHTIMGNFANFKGRASRSEYWRFVAVTIALGFIINVLNFIFSHTFLGSLISLVSFAYSCAILLPSIGIAVRRLHDVNTSGWVLLAGFIPFIGLVYVIYLLAKKGDEADNKFGSKVSYEVITPEEADCTGLNVTPTEAFDQKVMLASICLCVLNIWIAIASI